MVETQNLTVPPVIGLRCRQWKQVNTFIIKYVEMVENAWWQFGSEMTKVKKNRYLFWSMDMIPKLTQCYQFHACHWHGHTCLKNRTRRQQKRYKNTCQIDEHVKNNGWDTKYNLVSTWECGEAWEEVYALSLLYWHRLMNTQQTTWHIYQGIYQ